MEASWDKAIQGGENWGKVRLLGGVGPCHGRTGAPEELHELEPWCWEKPSALQELNPCHTAGARYRSTLELLPPKRVFPWFLSPKGKNSIKRQRAVVNSKSCIKQSRSTLQRERENEGEQAAWKQEAACNRVRLVFQSGGKLLSLSCVIWLSWLEALGCITN